MKDSCQWLNFRYGLDITYTHVAEAPLLYGLCKRYGQFWDGNFWYKKQSCVILRWPDWRDRYRIDHEKVRLRANLSKQTRLRLVGE